MKAPIPPNEAERLQALRRYSILDTPVEAAFDRITRLAARLLKVPIALVSLVDEDRQWFKSAYGMDARQTSRELSFCAHTILQDTVLEVPDATCDPRFSDNLMVTGEAHIRFYAGAPLQSPDGFNLGSLCAVDREPRTLTEDERQILCDLAAIVTDELALRVAVREISQQSAAIFHLKSGVIITDPYLPDNPMVFANPGFWQMTHYLPDEFLGRNCRFLQGPGTDAKTVEAIREAVADRRTFHGEILNYRKDGIPFWNELTISPVFDEAGHLINFVGLQTDITERKQQADELARNFTKLQELEALRDSLTHMIVHDLRTPLNTVIGFLSLLRAGAGGLSPQQLHWVELANSGATALREMISSLLDVHRFESGEMPLTICHADLRSIISEAVKPFHALLGSRSLVWHAPEQPVEAPCDLGLIERVLANLLSNAFKFTPPQGEIRLSLQENDDHVTVAVSDTGAGIPEKDHALIFEKFGQVKGTHQRHSTGLGLAFCKLAVEAHGGAIGVESAPGAGAKLWFSLPRKETRVARMERTDSPGEG